MHLFNRFCQGSWLTGGGILMMALFWLPILLIGYWLITRDRSPISMQQSNEALETLKMRYAKGEIDKEEFEEKKKHLQS